MTNGQPTTEDELFKKIMEQIKIMNDNQCFFVKAIDEFITDIDYDAVSKQIKK